MAGKIAIIGAGSVGTATAFALAIDGTPDEVVLVDLNLAKAQGEIMDIEHANAFIPYTEFTASKSYRAIKDADIVVITAGAAQKPGQTRRDLIGVNRKILKSIIAEVKRYAPKSILLIVTNPVDALTYFAKKDSGFPTHRVIGTGTTLDSARFRSLLAKRFKVNARHVHAYILGEHGDASFPVLSNAHVASIPLASLPGYKAAEMKALAKKAATVVYEIIKKKGATNLAIAICVREIVNAILNNSHEIFPVSSVLQGEYGLKNVAISTPSILGRKGIIQELEIPLNAEEKQALKKSVNILRSLIR